jgi:branched-chain amino acid transport system ATP-binding protein
MQEQAMLRLDNITMMFGGLAALSNVNVTVGRGELVGLIGPNGAGKTTAFNVITGVNQATKGAVHFNGIPIGRKRPSDVCRLGIARTFQNIRLFPTLSVLDNVRIARHLHCSSGFGAALAMTPKCKTEDRQLTEESYELLDTLGLGSQAHEEAKSLPYGKQRRLEIARALATKPKLLLLDEPAAGMNPSEKSELRQLTLDIRTRFGLSILLIEHDMRFVMDLCERIYVLDYGEVISEGPPDFVRSDPKVIEAYLGSESDGDSLDA